MARRIRTMTVEEPATASANARTEVEFQSRPRGPELLARAIRLLPQFTGPIGVRGPVGDESRGCWLIEGPIGVCTIHDNGGEFSVWVLNGRDLPAGEVPDAWFGWPLNAATIAARLAMVLRGELIDFDFELTDEEESIMREAK